MEQIEKLWKENDELKSKMRSMYTSPHKVSEPKEPSLFTNKKF